MNRSIIIIVLVLLGISIITGRSLANNSACKITGGSHPDINVPKERYMIKEKLVVDINNGTKPLISNEMRQVCKNIGALMDAKEHNQAFDILEDAITNESNPHLLAYKAEICFREGDLNKAAKVALEMENALKQNPNFLMAHLDLGLLYTRLGKLEKARKPFLRAIELGYDHARIFGLVGYAYQLDKEWLLAEMFYREAYKRDPENTEWTHCVININADWQIGLNQVIEEQNKIRSVSLTRPD